MSAVQDVNMLPSLLNLDPVVVQRLRRMRQIKRQGKAINIFKRWDNCLREEIDDKFCLRRTKYVTRLSLYYWMQSSDSACAECASHHEPEWAPSQQPYIVMMKANPMARGGLDFARIAVGIGVDIACFGAQLKTRYRDKVQGKINCEPTSDEDLGHSHCGEFHVDHGYIDESETDLQAAEIYAQVMGGDVDPEVHVSREELISRLDAIPDVRVEVYTGYQHLRSGAIDDSYEGPEYTFTGDIDIYTGHEELFTDRHRNLEKDEIYTGHEQIIADETLITNGWQSVPSRFGHFTPDHHIFKNDDQEETINEDDFTPQDPEPTNNMQKHQAKKHPADTAGALAASNRKKRSTTKMSAGKALTGGSSQKPVNPARPAGRTRKSAYLQSA
jgi:hypothetical protein